MSKTFTRLQTPPSSMRVIAVDPGYDRMGVAIMERDGSTERLLYSTCIETDRMATLPDRLATIGEQFDALLEEYHPHLFGVETLFFNQNRTTAIAVAEARGIAVFLARRHGCAIAEFGPQEVKVAVTGYGKSDKTAVFDMLTRLVKDIPPSAHDDEYDAIAIAVTTLAHHRA